MEGRIVTNQTAQELQGVFFDADTFFNFVQDINDVYFLFDKSSTNSVFDSSNSVFLVNFKFPTLILRFLVKNI